MYVHLNVCTQIYYNEFNVPKQRRQSILKYIVKQKLVYPNVYNKIYYDEWNENENYNEI